MCLCLCLCLHMCMCMCMYLWCLKSLPPRRACDLTHLNHPKRVWSMIILGDSAWHTIRHYPSQNDGCQNSGPDQPPQKGCRNRKQKQQFAENMSPAHCCALRLEHWWLLPCCSQHFEPRTMHITTKLSNPSLFSRNCKQRANTECVVTSCWGFWSTFGFQCFLSMALCQSHLSQKCSTNG